MNPAEPKLNGRKLRVAEDQPEYQAVTVVTALDPDLKAGAVIMAFALTEEERQRIIRGERTVYVSLLTFGRPQQPIRLAVGPEEFSKLYGIPLEQMPEIMPDDDAVEWPARPTTLPTNSEGLEQL